MGWAKWEVEKQMKGNQVTNQRSQVATCNLSLQQFLCYPLEWKMFEGQNTRHIVQLCEMINQEKDASCIKDQPGGMCVGASVNLQFVDMDDSKNRGTPKWMVYNGKPY